MNGAATPGALDEARRVMTICNACRYCEGLCATFQAMADRRAFSENDLDYLANLCHNCTACYFDCQYAPPHEFGVNVPRTLAALRQESYARYAWPAWLARSFERNGLVVSLVTAATLSIVLLLGLSLLDPAVLFGTHREAGAFYAVIGHGVMVSVATATFGFSLAALGIGLRRSWRAGREGAAVPYRAGPGAWLRALRDVATLKNLDGGHGEGCNDSEDRFSNARRYFHQATMWGFLLCFAATAVATLYHYGLGLVAPYPFFSVPVVLGTLGGVGLLAGPAGLAWIKRRSDPRPLLLRQHGMDYAFLALLFAVSLTGMLLLLLRATPAMGLLLVVHLACVLALFITLPYGKFVHAGYRFAALLRFAAEQRPGRVRR
jgi:citrate/tricarballylate utilization protein